jgi:PhnB protein
MKVAVYLNFPGNTLEAFNFYKSVFGGEFDTVVRFKDMPMEGFTIPEADADKIMHISLPLGDTRLMGTDTLESMGQKQINGTNVSISLNPADKAEADMIFSALSKDANVSMPMGDQVWGDYYGMLTDKFGVQWMLNVAAKRP